MSNIEHARALQQAGRWREAAEVYEEILRQQPDHVRALHLMGAVQLQAGRLESAVAYIERALELKPDYAEAHNNLGLVLQHRGLMEEAAQRFRTALEYVAGDADIWLNLGNALRSLSRLHDAIQAYQRAIELEPELALAHNNLGVAKLGQGETDAAVACFRTALTLAPDYVDAHSNLIQCMHYLGEFDAAGIYAEARRFNATHALPLTREASAHDNAPSPQRKLRIGYVSSDLRRHPVGYFFVPVFAHHDRQQFEVFCYSGVVDGDPVTEQFRAHSDHWRESAGMTDEALAQRVRADRIDVLVDLAGHSGLNRRLLMFARKPAPVQVTAGGHFGTTGMDAIDYLISDVYHTPSGSDGHFSETLVRLPDDYICYAAPRYAPPVGELPARARGTVTFGCFNNLAKVSSAVIALWASIMRTLPASRIRLHAREFSEPTNRERILKLFSEHGVEDARIDTQGHIPHKDLLAAYGEIDIALDPFPYSGGLTTCESLWMGVPVITMGGDTFCSRHSTSHLSNAGLAELVTDRPADYARKAVQLAGDLDRLAALRHTLREQVAGSALCDQRRYAKDLQDAYRTMWHRWCELQKRS